MTRLVVQRSAAVFGALYLAPGDPIQFLTKGRPVDPATVAALRAQYHLDDPFLGRYWAWLVAAVQGDFGQSITFRQDVAGLIGSRLPTTLWLVGLSALLIVLGGILVGTLSALRPGRVDEGVMLGATLVAAIPIFVMAIALVSLFAVRLGWFPTYGSGDEGVLSRLRHLTLPALALGLGAVAFVARVTRAALRDELDREHVRAARARGLAEHDVLVRHVFRNAFAPIMTVAALTVAGLFVGTAIVEKAFALNGVGALLIDSVNAGDFPVVQAIALLMVLVFVVANLGSDLVQRLMDPRQRAVTQR